MHGEELATGRFILLHDPAGSALWDGTFRIVTYIRARMESEMGNDAMLGSVAWTWLVDALNESGADYRQAGGTATRVLSESYGTLADRPRDHRHRAAGLLDPRRPRHLHPPGGLGGHGLHLRRLAAAAQRRHRPAAPPALLGTHGPCGPANPAPRSRY